MTRPANQSTALVRELKRRGATAIVAPAIRACSRSFGRAHSRAGRPRGGRVRMGDAHQPRDGRDARFPRRSLAMSARMSPRSARAPPKRSATGRGAIPTSSRRRSPPRRSRARSPAARAASCAPAPTSRPRASRTRSPRKAGRRPASTPTGRARPRALPPRRAPRLEAGVGRRRHLHQCLDRPRLRRRARSCPRQPEGRLHRPRHGA